MATYVITGNLLTDGHFLLNQAGASSIGFTTDIYKLAFALLTGPHDFPYLTLDLIARLLVAVFVAVVLLKRSKVHFDQGVSIYFLTALLVNLITMFKVGAAFNYIVEAHVLGGVVLGIGAFRLKENWQSAGNISRYRALAAGTGLFVLPMLWFTVINVSTVPQVFQGLKRSDAYEQLQKLPPTALLGDMAFVHPAESAHALSDPVPYAQLTGNGKISRDPLTTRLAARSFTHVVLSPGTKYLFFAPDRAPWAGRALETYYRQHSVRPEYEIWIPAETETTTSAEAMTQQLSE